MKATQIITFNSSCIGASHVSNGLPCQDASIAGIYKDTCIAIVSDGHGNRRHFRSDSGSKFACEVAFEEIKKYIDTDISVEELKQNICNGWKNKIRADFANNPLTETELEEQKRLVSVDEYNYLISGNECFIPYGCTLVCVLSNENGHLALQVGDGSFAVVDCEGYYSWPMPESAFNDGNKTFSLCSNNPMADFRHVKSNDPTAALFVYTDGIEKLYPNEGKGIISLLHWILTNYRSDKTDKDEALEKTLNYIANSSQFGDDASISGIISAKYDMVSPRLSIIQIEREYLVLKARLNEIRNTISYNVAQLSELKSNQQNDYSDAISKIESIIERKKADYEQMSRSFSVIEKEYELAKEKSHDVEECPFEDSMKKKNVSPTNESKNVYDKKFAQEKSECLYRLERNNVLLYIRCFGPDKGLLEIKNDQLCISKQPLINYFIPKRKSAVKKSDALVFKRENITAIKTAKAYKRNLKWRVIGFGNRELALSASPGVLSKIDDWANAVISDKEE